MTNQRHSYFFKGISAFLVLTTAFLTTPVSAAIDPGTLPTGYQAEVGNSSYAESGSVGTLTSVGGPTIGSHETFSVGSAASFIANIDTAHLNRVRSASPSEIFGQMTVNGGKFFLVNPNGIFFAPGSQVNAAGLVASSLNISNQDFLNGQYRFNQEGNPASVINAGNMNIGDGGLALLGGAVENQGVIEARESSVVMAGGKEMTLSFDNGGMISVLVDKGTAEKVNNNGQEIKDAVSNSGIIRANGGKVVMTAEATNNIFDKLVNQRGLVEANSIGSKTGEVVLSSVKSAGIVENSGSINTKGLLSGEKGGRIEVVGEKTGILGGSRIDASGNAGGGEVYIGGGYRGVGTKRNADVSYVAADAKILADATHSGDGGQVVIWADDTTRFYGDVSVKGGALSGNGGRVEVSGKRYVDIHGTVDRTAAHGAAGSLLIDPTDLTIDDAGVDDTLWTGTSWADDSALTTSQIDIDTLESFLDLGDTIVDATAGGGAGAGNIILNAGRDLKDGAAGNSGFGLTLIANDITLTSGIAFTGAGSVLLNAAGNVLINNPIVLAGVGNLTVVSNSIGITAAITAHDVTLTAATIALKAVTTSGLQSYTGATTLGGNLTATTAGSTIDLHGNTTLADLDAGNPDATTLTVSTNDGNITFDGKTDGTLGSEQNLSVSAGTGDVTFSDSIGSTVALNTLTINNTGAQILPSLISAQNFVLSALNLTADYILNLGTGTFTLSSANTNGHDLTLIADELNFNGGADTISGGGNLILKPSTLSENINIAGTTENAGSLDLTQTDLLALANGFDLITIGDAAGTGVLDFINTADAFTFNDAIEFQNAGVGSSILVDGLLKTAGAASTISVVGSGATTTLNADVVTAGADITINDSVILGTDVLLDTTNGNAVTTGADISITGAVNSDATARDLTITAGTTGFLDFAAAVGAGSSLDLLDVTAAQVTFDSTVQANNISSTATDTTFTNDVTALTDDVTVSGNLILAGDTTVTTGGAAGDDFVVIGTTETDGTPWNLTANAGFGDVTFTGAIGTAPNELDSLMINADEVIFGSTVRANDISSTATTTTLTDDVTALTDGVAINGNLILANNVVVTTGGGAGDNLSVTGTVDSDSSATLRDLTLNSGAGDISFGNHVGETTQLGDFLIQSANDVTLATDKNITAESIIQQSGTGTTSFTGDVTSTEASGIDLTTLNIILGDSVLDDVVTTLSGGPLTLRNAGLLTLKATLNLSGPFSQLGTGLVDLFTSITTSNQNMTFAGDVTLQADNLELNAGTGTISFLAGSSVTDAASAFDFTMTADEVNLVDAGSFALNGDLLLQPSTSNLGINIAGVTEAAGTLDLTETDLNAFADGFNLITIGRANSSGVVNYINTSDTFEFEDALTIQSPFAGSELHILNQLVSNQSTADITLIGSHATTYLAADITTSGADILINDSVVVQTNVTLDTTAGAAAAGANIQVTDVINGRTIAGQTLTLNAGTGGNILLDGAVGAGTRLGALLFERANNLTATDIRSSSIATGATGITGTANFNGQLNTNQAAGINLNGAVININDTVTTSNNGVVTISNTGNLNITGDMNLDGAFIQDGSGDVFTSGDITTSADDISFAEDVTLNGNVQLSTVAGIGNISFAKTVDSDAVLDRNLTLIAGAGNISFSGIVGGTNGLDALVLSSAENVTATDAITARTITQSAGTGTSTFDALNTSGPAGIVLNGTNFVLGDTVTTTGNGGVSITNAGTLALDGALNLDGSFVQDGSGISTLRNDITTTGDLASFLAPVVLAVANVHINSANGNINFSDSINGATDATNGFELTAGTGNILLASSVGQAVGARLGAILINSATNVTAVDSIKAVSITQTAGTGTTQFVGSLDTNGSGIDLNGTHFNLAGPVTTTGAGNVEITNSGILNLGSSADMSLSGSFLQNGGGSVNLASDIVTAASNITFTDAVTLLGNVSLNSNGGNILFINTLDATTPGVEDLTLAAGAGNIDFDSTLGATRRLGALSIQSADDVTADQAITAVSISQISGTGLTTFSGTLNTNSAAGVDLTGSEFAVDDNVTTLNNGGFNITNSSDFNLNATMNLDGSFVQDGSGDNFLNGNINTTGDTISYTSDVELTGDSSLDSTTGGFPAGAAITFVSTLHGNGGNLTVDSGLADTLFNGNVGDGDPLGTGNGAALTLNSLGQTTFNGTLETSSGMTAAGDVVFNEDVMLGDGDTGSSFNEDVIFNTGLTGQSFSAFDGVVFGQAAQNHQVTINGVALSINTNDSTLLFNSLVDGSANLSLDSGTSATTFEEAVGSTTAIGTGTGAAITIATGGNTQFKKTVEAASGILATHDTGTVQFDQNVTLANGDTGSSFNGNVILDGMNYSGFDGLTFGNAGTDQLTLSTSDVSIVSNNGDIIFNALVDGGRDLSVNSGTSMTTFNAAVGQTTAIGDGTGAALALLGSGLTTFNNTLRANSGMTAQGPVVFNGNVDLLDGDTGTNLNGNVTLNNISFDGFDGINFGNTSTDQITLGVRVSSIDSNDSILNFNGLLDGAQDLTVDSGTAATNFNAAVGSTTPLGDGFGAALTINTATGVTTFNSTLATSSGITAVGPVTLKENVTVIGGDTDSTFNGDVVLDGMTFTTNKNVTFGDATTDQITLSSGAVSIDTTLGGADQDITFEGKIDGAQNLSLAAGNSTGDIAFRAAIGSVTPIGILAILSALNIDALSDILAQGITQSSNNAAGTTFYHGNITTSSDGINITDSFDVTFGDLPAHSKVVRSNGGGNISLAHSGLLTINADIVLDGGGSFSDLGTGSTALNGNISAGAGDILFNANLLLLPDSTTLSGNNITFNQFVDGEGDGTKEDLSIVATGNVNFLKAVGFGNIPTSQTGLGNLTINQAGVLSIASVADVLLAAGANFLQNGTGSVSTGGDVITNGGSIGWNGPITLTDNVLMDTTNAGIVAAGNNISFADTLNGSFDMTLQAGSGGDIALNGAVGQTTRLGNLIINNAKDVVISQVTSLRNLIQNAFASYGTTTINGAFDTDGVIGVDLNGNNFTINNTVGTTNGGSVEITNAGLLTIASLGDMMLDGSFTQNGTGLVSTGGDITTTDDAISFLTAVTLTSAVALSTGVGVGNITFNDTLDGAQDLTLTAGTGNVLFDRAVGSGARLGAMLINSATNVTASSTIQATSLTQNAGTGLSYFVGDVDTNAVQGVNLTGNQFQFDGNVLATNGSIAASGTGTILVGTADLLDSMEADLGITLRGDTVTLNSTLESDADGVGAEGISVTADQSILGTSDLLMHNTVTSHGGAINLSADNDVLMDAIADIFSNDGNVSVTADLDGSTAGELAMEYLAGDRAEIQSGLGMITLSAGENVTLGGLTSGNGTSTAVRVTSTDGEIVDGGETVAGVPFFDIDARNGGIVLDAEHGIGDEAPNGALEIWTSQLSATSVDGNIVIDLNSPLVNGIDLAVGSGPVLIDNAAVTGGTGNITIQQLADSPLTITNASTADGAINLSSIANLVVNGIISAGGPTASVTLTADAVPGQNGLGDLLISALAQVSSNGPVTLTGVNINILGSVFANGLAFALADIQILLGKVQAISFNLRAGQNILDENGSESNLIGAQNSFLTAGGFIGRYFDPIEVDVPGGDLIISVSGSEEGQSANFHGFIGGDLVTNLTPGLVLYNAHAVAGEPLMAYNSGLNQELNLIAFDRYTNGMEDLQHISSLQRGMGLVPGLENLFIPTIDTQSSFDLAPNVVVSERGARLWKKKIRPVAPVVVPQVVAVPPTPVVEEAVVPTAPVAPQLSAEALRPTGIYPPSSALPIPPASMRPVDAPALAQNEEAADTTRLSWIDRAQNWYRSNFQKQPALQPQALPKLSGNRLFQQSVEEAPINKEENQSK